MVLFNLHIHFLCILNDAAEVLLTHGGAIFMVAPPCGSPSMCHNYNSKLVIVMRSLFVSFAIFHVNVNLFHFISLQL